jgi:hypothetical protein
MTSSVCIPHVLAKDERLARFPLEGLFHIHRDYNSNQALELWLKFQFCWARTLRKQR